MSITQFVHLSDLHVIDPSTPDAHLYSDTTETLRLVQARIATLDPRPDFIVISGDLTNRGTPQDFAAVRALLQGFEVPVLLALGNHDTRPAFYRTILDDPSRTDEPYFHADVMGGLHVITLDSSMPGAVTGNLEPEQRAWFAAELLAHPDLPKLIVVHHPPGDQHVPVFDHINWLPEDRAHVGEALRTAVGAGARVVGVLSGHVHYDQFSVWNGVPCLISAGLYNQTDTLERDGVRALRGGSFNVCRVRDGELTSFTVPLPTDGQALYHVTSAELLRSLAPSEGDHAEAKIEPLV